MPYVTRMKQPDGTWKVISPVAADDETSGVLRFKMPNNTWLVNNHSGPYNLKIKCPDGTWSSVMLLGPAGIDSNIAMFYGLLVSPGTPVSPSNPAAYGTGYGDPFEYAFTTATGFTTVAVPGDLDYEESYPSWGTTKAFQSTASSATCSLNWTFSGTGTYASYNYMYTEVYVRLADLVSGNLPLSLLSVSDTSHTLASIQLDLNGTFVCVHDSDGGTETISSGVTPADLVGAGNPWVTLHGTIYVTGASVEIEFGISAVHSFDNLVSFTDAYTLTGATVPLSCTYGNFESAGNAVTFAMPYVSRNLF